MAIITDAKEKRIEKAVHSHLMHASRQIFKGNLLVFSKLSMVDIWLIIANHYRKHSNHFVNKFV